MADKTVQKSYDREDVTTWPQQEFDTKVSEKIVAFWQKIEYIKNLLMDGKQVVAYQHLQGLGDSVQVMVKLYAERISAEKDVSSNN